MKGIKLWKVKAGDGGCILVDEIENVSQTETENQLEEVITKNPELLMKGLELVGRQTETAGGPLDLLGVDRDGRLVVFELKRGVLTREAVAQVIDYASYLKTIDPEELSKHIVERSGKNGIQKIDDFLMWYQEEFGKKFEENEKPAMVLVGLGADEKTTRMISFLSESGLDISLVTFYGFKQGDELILAKQVEIQPPTIHTPIYTKKGNLEKLKKRARELRVEEYYYDIAAFFRDHLPPSYEYPNPGGYSYSMPELTETGSLSNRVYISSYLINHKPGQVQVSVQERAIEAASPKYKEIVKPIEGRIIKTSGGNNSILIKSRDDWNELKTYFAAMCEEILKGWKRSRDRQSEEEFE